MKKKTVLITGISGGLGKEFTSVFFKAGWNICGCYKTNKPDKQFEDALFLQADISKHDDVKLLINQSVEKFGSIDCLINNAGIGKNKLISRESFSNWDEVISTNFSGAFYVLKETFDIMAKQKNGSIINISSISAYKSYVGAGSYSASKMALVALTKTAAREGGRFGIKVNAVLPGFHQTTLGKTAGKKYIDTIKEDSVLKTTTDIKELTDFILYLANAKTISGQVFNIDSRII
jgi:3-oxoacyl-[acyl-carrier protein] reductase